jgi:hypothetical protein
MTTQEHLNKILEKCREILEITKKRTPGEWKAESSRAYCTDETVTHNVVGPPSDFMYLQEFPFASTAGHSGSGSRPAPANCGHTSSGTYANPDPPYHEPLVHGPARRTP